jgi:hypothetical protein
MISRWYSAPALGALAVLWGCGGAPPPARGPGQLPPASVRVGDCADPARDGVISEPPRLEHDDHDLDGDAVKEVVTVDRRLCTPEGNCYWNLFAGRAEGGCHRYLGTIEAGWFQRLRDRGEDGYHDLRAWWRFSADRSLVQQYRFRAGGYQVVDALICRRVPDGQTLCAEDRPPPR